MARSHGEAEGVTQAGPRAVAAGHWRGTNAYGRTLRERCGSYLQLGTESERLEGESDDHHVSRPGGYAGREPAAARRSEATAPGDLGCRGGALAR